MKSLALLFALLFAAGCAARTSIPENEKNYLYEINHGKLKSEAYLISELWVSEVFVSGKTVVDLKQPETGIIVANPIVEWWAGGEGIGAQFHSAYTLKIVNSNSKTTLSMTLHGTKNDYGQTVFPPSSQIEKIKSGFESNRDSLAKALGSDDKK